MSAARKAPGRARSPAAPRPSRDEHSAGAPTPRNEARDPKAPRAGARGSSGGGSSEGSFGGSAIEASQWPRRARAVAAQIEGAALHAGALREIRGAVAAGEPVALACSGGADSVALVLALWAHVPEMKGRWRILHFDHALRGRASTGDARFVRALARGLGEVCVIERWKRGGPAGRAGALRHAAIAPRPARAGGLPQAHGANSPDESRRVAEADAREARFSFFARAMGACGARVLALGHQADDVVETMLMRLVRGSATAGLAAPRPVHRRADGTVRVRPLLDLDAAALRAALLRAKVNWREDGTNTGEVFTRNRVRLSVLPVLRAAMGRDLAKGFLEARRALEEDDEALEALLEEHMKSGGLASLRGRPRALARRAVHAWLQASPAGASLSRVAADGFIDAVAAGRAVRQSAGVGRFVVFDGRSLTIETAVAADRELGWGGGSWLEVGGIVVNAQGDRIEASCVRLTAALRRAILAGRCSPVSTVFLATDLTRLRVRKRTPGDRYRPLGASGRVRLQDAFVNRKIARDLRDRLPVVTNEQGEILWVPGLPPAQELSLQQGTKLVVQLTYHPAESIVS